MSDTEILLAKMRRGLAILKLLQADIEEAGTLLRHERISLAGAILMLRDAGVDEFCGLEPAAAGLLQEVAA